MYPTAAISESEEHEQPWGAVTAGVGYDVRLVEAHLLASLEYLVCSFARKRRGA